MNFAATRNQISTVRAASAKPPRSGFSFTDFLVVLAVLAVLGAVALPLLSGREPPPTRPSARPT